MDPHNILVDRICVERIGNGRCNTKKAAKTLNEAMANTSISPDSVQTVKDAITAAEALDLTSAPKNVIDDFNNVIKDAKEKVLSAHEVRANIFIHK